MNDDYFWYYDMPMNQVIIGLRGNYHFTVNRWDFERVMFKLQRKLSRELTNEEVYKLCVKAFVDGEEQLTIESPI